MSSLVHAIPLTRRTVSPLPTWQISLHPLKHNRGATSSVKPLLVSPRVRCWEFPELIVALRGGTELTYLS